MEASATLQEHLLALLSANPAFSALDSNDWALFINYLTFESVPEGAGLIREGETDHDLFFLVNGEATLVRHQLTLRGLHPGELVGELGLLAGRPRAATVVAQSPLTVARLSQEQWHRLSHSQPALALAFLQALIRVLGNRLTDMTDNVGTLLKERSLPRHTHVTLDVNGLSQQVETGTRLGDLLPRQVDGHLVVAGLFNNKPFSLNSPVTSDGRITPLTTAHWEGQRIFRHAAGLLLLEAASQLQPPATLRLGISVGGAQAVMVEASGGRSPGDLEAALNTTIQQLVKSNVPLRQELWTVEEAAEHLRAQAWPEAAMLMRTWRETTVPLVSCGSQYALSLVPLLPTTGPMKGVSVRVQANVLTLDFNGALQPGQRHRSLSPPTANQMALEHRQWLDAMGISCVGAFNDACISGQVTPVIQISEGFHEKRIARVADQIASAPVPYRIISVAGPSSSGKTTFIKRLMIQLRVNGLRPIAVSLDDYFLDRERTPRTADGDFDFEALEALDLPLLNAQLTELLAEKTVRLARFDFKLGKSHPEGGPETCLGDRDVLLLEGIHGLNPRLLEKLTPAPHVFRLFVHPMTALPFDHLTRVNVTDLRLLRRIVRDRHSRGLSAADNILRWPAVRDGERRHIFPYLDQADVVFDTALIYELSVLKVYAERYLLEVPQDHPAFATAFRLRRLVDMFVTIYPDHVPSTSLLREFIGGSGFDG